MIEQILSGSISTGKTITEIKTICNRVHDIRVDSDVNQWLKKGWVILSINAAAGNASVYTVVTLGKIK